MINFNAYTFNWVKCPQNGKTGTLKKKLKLPALLDMLFTHRYRKNIKKLYEIKELIEIALDHGYDTSLKNAIGRDLFDYLHKYQYGPFIPDRLRSIINDRYPNLLSLNISSNELNFETKIRAKIDRIPQSLSSHKMMIGEKFLNIVKEFKACKYNKNPEKINEAIQRLKDIADLLNEEKGLKNAVADGLFRYFHGLYGFLCINELYVYWNVKEIY